MFVLTVRHHGGSQQYQLSEGRTVVGRSPQCDVVINDDSISRQHARLVVGADQVELTDLQSRNGTYLAGEPVRDEILRSGERMRLGDLAVLLGKHVERVSEIDV